MVKPVSHPYLLYSYRAHLLIVIFDRYGTGKRDSMSASPTPDAFELAKDDEQEDAQVKVQAQNGNAEQVSAADYDPSLDRREDEQKRI
jgi:hypothetical protein